MSEALTVEEVAKFLRVSRHTVYRLVERGEIPGRKIGRVWRFPRVALEQFLSGDQPLSPGQPKEAVDAPSHIGR